MKDSLNIVIAGATGYIGLELIKILTPCFLKPLMIFSKIVTPLILANVFIPPPNLLDKPPARSKIKILFFLVLNSMFPR